VRPVFTGPTGAAVALSVRAEISVRLHTQEKE
jgi:hypothetical protein